MIIKYTPIQIQALIAMAAAGWEAVNLATHAGVDEAEKQTATKAGAGKPKEPT